MLVQQGVSFVGIRRHFVQEYRGSVRLHHCARKRLLMVSRWGNRSKAIRWIGALHYLVRNGWMPIIWQFDGDDMIYLAQFWDAGLGHTVMCHKCRTNCTPITKSPSEQASTWWRSGNLTQTFARSALQFITRSL